MRWLELVAVGVALMVVTWAVLVVLARRLPSGVLRDLAGMLPACLTTIRRLRRDPRVPRRAKVAVVLAGLWVLSPIDLIPEFLPVIGPLDDVVVVALAFRYAYRRVPPEALAEAWAGEPHVLERLLGRTGAASGQAQATTSAPPTHGQDAHGQDADGMPDGSPRGRGR